MDSICRARQRFPACGQKDEGQEGPMVLPLSFCPIDFVSSTPPSHWLPAGPVGRCLKCLLAQSMKYFIFDRSSCPPSCCLHANSPSSSPVFTGGILAVR